MSLPRFIEIDLLYFLAVISKITSIFASWSKPKKIVSVSYTHLPSNWEIQGFGEPIIRNIQYVFSPNPPYIDVDNPVGTYRRTFTVPQNWQGREVLLHFGSISGYAPVSYTHLDVYKGQLWRHPTLQLQIEQRRFVGQLERNLCGICRTGEHRAYLGTYLQL